MQYGLRCCANLLKCARCCSHVVLPLPYVMLKITWHTLAIPGKEKGQKLLLQSFFFSHDLLHQISFTWILSHDLFRMIFFTWPLSHDLFHMTLFRSLAYCTPNDWILIAQATAKSVAEMSKAAVDHYGSTSCPITSRLASVPTKRAEDECHKLWRSWSWLHMIPYKNYGNYSF